MPVSSLAFLFDIVVEELKSFVQTKRFVIKSEFADIFSLVLKNPEPKEKKKKRKKSSKKTKSKSKCVKNPTDNAQPAKKNQKGQTILFVGNLDILLSHMMQYPMEICLCKETDPDERVASTLIPWGAAFIEYLMSLYHAGSQAAPAHATAAHSVFDEASSKRMASVRLTVKLRVANYVNFNQYRLISNKYPNTFLMMDIDTVYVDQSTATRLSDGTGTIKTIYSGGKQKKRSSISKRNAKREANIAKLAENRDPTSTHALRARTRRAIDKSILLHLTRSEADVASSLKLDLFSSKSCADVKQINLFNYIFGDPKGPFGNTTYTVGYVTVDERPSQSMSTPSPQVTESPGKTSTKSSTSMIDHRLTTTVQCNDPTCTYKKERPLLEKPDDRIMLDVTSLKKACCVTETIKQTFEIKGVGQLEGQPPCFCACECTLGFEKKTTFCQVCGGYEKPGEDLDGKPQYLLPDPCPAFHKLGRINTGSTSGSETKKQTRKRTKTSEADKDKKEGKNDRFKFNYGYKAPQIGHSRCALPCTGTMSNVPRAMGWLWTADNVPGMVFRPAWKPGAINKVVARKLRMALHPGEVISKRRKAPTVKKRPPKRPLLVVHKKSGEFTVTMETMKPYNRPRTLNQQPYEDKDPVTYTIGRTEAENRERRLKRERAARRLEREQREFIQSAFRDMCKDICMKTYQQALGILPDAEDPECACHPALPGPDHDDHSCSCSDDGNSLKSDTDSDEWFLEFTPPNAHFDPNYAGTKVKQGDKETQYTYMDFRVKLLDRLGNPVPRFFKGLDGKEQCSDLGGFWGADHQWQLINVDGFIGPDGRWAPYTFFGPSGEQVDTKTGKFQDSSGEWLVIGIDGYVDVNNKWRFYKHSLNKSSQGKRKHATPKPTGDKKSKPAKKEESVPTFSCFGDATPVDLSRMGIVGHGPDKKLLNRMLKDLIGKGVKVNIPEPSRVPNAPVSKLARARRQAARAASESERSACRHAPPSDRGTTRQPDGSVTYFRSRKFVSRNPQERMHYLEQQGKSLSAFHEPCLHSTTDHRRHRRVVVTAPYAPHN